MESATRGPVASLLCIISNLRGTKEVPEGLPEGTTFSKTREETEGALQGPQSAEIRNLSLYVLLKTS